MGTFQYDPSISLGTILSISAFLFGAWKVNNNIVSEIREVKVKLEILWKRYEHESNHS